MPFSDTTNKNGMVQRFEKYTGLGDGAVSNNPTLLKIVTADFNESFDEVMPYVMSYSDKQRWDDTNHTDHPIATFNIVSGQPDYSILEDDNSLDILNITDVRILASSTATQYTDIERITLDNPYALDVMSPNSIDTGIPTVWLEKGNVIFLGLGKPNYSATNGIKVFFEREQSYFVSTDTTKEPGIPRPFHRLLPMIAARGWLIVNKPTSIAIADLGAKILEAKKQLSDLIDARNPTRKIFTTAPISFR